MFSAICDRWREISLQKVINISDAWGISRMSPDPLLSWVGSGHRTMQNHDFSFKLYGSIFSVSQKAIILLSYRWYAYKKLRWHYFLFDFCYFTNFFILVYLWLPLGDSIRGLLFPIVFGFSNGPVLSAIVLWTNSVVPHSLDKMTSLFIHLSPSLALWGIRWWVYGVWIMYMYMGMSACD